MASGTPTGVVTARLADPLGDDRVLGTATLDESGRATFSTTDAPAGLSFVHADYGGDSNFNPSDNAITQILEERSHPGVGGGGTSGCAPMCGAGGMVMIPATMLGMIGMRYRRRTRRV